MDGVAAPLLEPEDDRVSVCERVTLGLGESDWLAERDALGDVVGDGVVVALGDCVCVDVCVGVADSVVDAEIDWEGLIDCVSVAEPDGLGRWLEESDGDGVSAPDGVADGLRVAVSLGVAEGLLSCVADCVCEPVEVGDWLGVNDCDSDGVAVMLGESVSTNEFDGLCVEDRVMEGV